MTTTAAAPFAYAPIRRLHEDRTRQIRTITHPDAPQRPDSSAGTAFGYAVAHHVLEGAESAARARDVARFDWYATNPDAGAGVLASPTAAGPRVIVAPDLSRLPTSPISDTPYYVLGPDSCAAPRTLQDLAAAAYSTADAAGFGDLLAAHAVVVCLLRTKTLGQTLDSWTITRLPGTVFTDHIGDPVVLARDLIHEGGHNWLNDALTATRSKVSDTERFFSPWKDTVRPAFGFLHACWSFPLTMIYTARIIDQTTGDLRKFLAAYLDKQRPLLAATAADHARALDLVADDDLRTRLRDVHQQAAGL
ncbi:HEXXH motif-containing putative peptide modification protein [Kitasatospora sp. NPDC059973]|uniref:aKG-HExxH-type peptide beta-hydroxylase n=1 Tax=Kitasatospora sp. NPDC059973 TaxID=3347020 RepID=UPI003699AF61